MSLVGLAQIAIVLCLIWIVIKYMKKPAHGAPPLVPWSLPVLGHMVYISRDPHKFFINARKTCGPVYSIDLLWQRTVVIADRTLYPQYLKAREDQLSVQKGMEDFHLDKVMFSKPHYLELTNELVKKATQDALIVNIRSEVIRTFEELPEKGKLDLDVFSRRLAFNVVSFIVYGERLSDAAIAAYDDFENSTGLMAFAGSFLPAFIIKRFFLPRVLAKKPKVADHVRKFVDKARDNPEAQSILLKRAFTILDNGKPIDNEGVTNLTVAVLLAAVSNTTGSVANILAHLADYPEKIEGLKIHEGEILKNVEVHKWIMECSRVSAGFLTGARTAVAEVEIGGYTIPEGTATIADIQTPFCLSPLVIPADRFAPERWSGDDTEQYLYKVLNWSAGIHTCPAKAFSVVEMKYVLAAAVEMLDIEPAKPERRYTVSAPFYPQTTKMVRNYVKKKTL